MNKTLKKSETEYNIESDPTIEDLEYINRNFAFGIKGISDQNSDNKKLSGKHALIYSFISRIFDPYISSGVRFRSSIVRILNELCKSRKINFNHLSDEIDLKVQNRIDDYREENHRVLTEINTRIEKLESWQHDLDSKFEQLDSVTKGIEAILVNSAKSNIRNDKTDNDQDILPEEDTSYLLLENRYRGSEELIRSRMIPHADRIENLVEKLNFNNPDQPGVIEIGCGRGELLEILTKKNIPSLGIEMDKAMVKRCMDKGLKVTEEDANSYLKRIDDSSVSCVIAIQVIEHMTNEYRSQFLELVKQKLVSGGYLILETINTSSFLPLLHNYFRDPTHIFPLHPDTLKTFIEYAGFHINDILYTSEYPAEAKLSLLEEQAGMPPRYNQMIKQLNERFMHINKLFYGSQDYSVIASVSK